METPASRATSCIVAAMPVLLLPPTAVLGPSQRFRRLGGPPLPGYIVVDGGCGTVLGTWPVPGTPVGPVRNRAHREDQHARRRRLTSCCGAGGAFCATACGASSWPCACGAS